MKSKYAAAREFVRGAARRKDLVYILSKAKKLVAEDVAHSNVLGLYQGNWAAGFSAEWDSSAVAVARLPKEAAMIVGEDGDVAVYVGTPDPKLEQLEPQPVLIRRASTIDGYVYACGMKRQVYHRIGEAQWIDISAPFPSEAERVGFEGIDGFSANEVYAVGWDGEIWQFDGKRWVDRTSPTNVILTAVCCAGDGVVYVTGQQGVMLRGRNGEWELIEWEEEVDVDLWDLCWFQDKLYVASNTAIYTLEGSTLIAVDFGKTGTPTCFSLTSAEGVLWSIGHADVASFDGTTWRLYE